MTLLETIKLKKIFGGLVAVDDVDIKVEQNEILGVIGPNGAGKTTFFNTISGYHKPTSGKVVFRGKDVTGLPMHRLAKMGLVRTFQATSLFHESTVLENVIVGHHLQSRVPPWRTLLNTRSEIGERQAIHDNALRLLDRMGLGKLEQEKAKNLPHGHQRLLGICIAMAARPTLLLLDEPVSGMNPEETMAASELIKEIKREGITVVLVEHDMKMVMGVCDRIVVLNFSRKIAEGRPEDIKNNQEVIDAYLGAGDYVA